MTHSFIVYHAYHYEVRAAGTNNTEPALFLVQRGKISLTGYVRSLSLVDWCAALSLLPGF